MIGATTAVSFVWISRNYRTFTLLTAIHLAIAYILRHCLCERAIILLPRFTFLSEATKRKVHNTLGMFTTFLLAVFALALNSF